MTPAGHTDRFRVVLKQLPEGTDRLEQVRDVLLQLDVDPAVADRALVAVPAVIASGDEAEIAKHLVTRLARVGALATIEPVRSGADLSRARRAVKDRREQRKRWMGLGAFAAILVAIYAFVPKPLGLELAPKVGRTYRFEQLLTVEHQTYLEDGSDVHAGGGWAWTLERTVEAVGDTVVVRDRFVSPTSAMEVAGAGAARYSADLDALETRLAEAEIRRVFTRDRRQLEVTGHEALTEISAYPGALFDGVLGRFFFPEQAPKIGETWLAALSTRDALEFRVEASERRQGRRCVRAVFQTVALPNAEAELRSYAPGWIYGDAEGVAWFDRATGLIVELTMQAKMSWGWSGGTMQVGLDHRLLGVR